MCSIHPAQLYGRTKRAFGNSGRSVLRIAPSQGISIARIRSIEHCFETEGDSSLRADESITRRMSSNGRRTKPLAR